MSAPPRGGTWPRRAKWPKILWRRFDVPLESVGISVKLKPLRTSATKSTRLVKQHGRRLWLQDAGCPKVTKTRRVSPEAGSQACYTRLAVKVTRLGSPTVSVSRQRRPGRFDQTSLPPSRDGVRASGADQRHRALVMFGSARSLDGGVLRGRVARQFGLYLVGDTSRRGQGSVRPGTRPLTQRAPDGVQGVTSRPRVVLWPP